MILYCPSEYADKSRRPKISKIGTKPTKSENKKKAKSKNTKFSFVVALYPQKNNKDKKKSKKVKGTKHL